MFERFTADARAAVVEAQTVARSRSDGRIDTRHLLLGIASVPDGVGTRALTDRGLDHDRLATEAARHTEADALDAEVLATLGIDLDAVRARADAVFGHDALNRAGRPPKRGHVPFAKDARKTLEVALREAVHRGHRHIDSGHILLALIRLTDTPGHEMLRHTGTDLDALRRAVLARWHPDAAA